MRVVSFKVVMRTTIAKFSYYPHKDGLFWIVEVIIQLFQRPVYIVDICIWTHQVYIGGLGRPVLNRSSFNILSLSIGRDNFFSIQNR